MSHLEFAAIESAQLQDTDWDRWIRAVERDLGHDLDGDQDVDGYSMDGAGDAFFKRKESVAQYVAGVLERRPDNHRFSKPAQ